MILSHRSFESGSGPGGRLTRSRGRSPHHARTAIGCRGSCRSPWIVLADDMAEGISTPVTCCRRFCSAESWRPTPGLRERRWRRRGGLRRSGGRRCDAVAARRRPARCPGLGVPDRRSDARCPARASRRGVASVARGAELQRHAWHPIGAHARMATTCSAASAKRSIASRHRPYRRVRFWRGRARYSHSA